MFGWLWSWELGQEQASESQRGQDLQEVCGLAALAKPPACPPPTSFLGLAVGSRRMTSALNSFNPGFEVTGPAHLFRFSTESSHPCWMARAARADISFSVSSVDLCGASCLPTAERR